MTYRCMDGAEIPQLIVVLAVFRGATAQPLFHLRLLPGQQAHQFRIHPLPLRQLKNQS